AFSDSNGDGIGDFKGLTAKLDYLHDLGVTAIWLLPFYPSPLRDDGYDIADYTDIHPTYGTLRDFKAFMREARWRGLKVITELGQPRGPPRDVQRRGLLDGPRRRRHAPGRGALPHRAGGHELREPARDPRDPEAAPCPHRRAVPGPHAARRGQPVAGGGQRVL